MAFPRALALLILTLMAAAPASAAYPYEATVPFPSVSGDAPTLTAFAGAITADTAPINGGYAFANVTAMTLSGIDEAFVYDGSITEADLLTGAKRFAGPLELQVHPGSLVAFAPSTTARSHLETGYALALPLALDETIGDVTIGASLVTLSVTTTVTFPDPIRATADFATGPNTKLLLLSPDSGLTLTRNGAEVARLQGAQAEDAHGVLLRGTIVVQPIVAQAALVPLPPGSAATVAAATGDALGSATKSLSLNQIQSTLELLRGTEPQHSEPAPASPLGGLEGILIEVLNSGLIQSGPNVTFSQLTLVRGGTLQLDAQAGPAMRIHGDGAFNMQAGHIAGADPLVAIGWFALPWWSYALWAAAIGLFVTVQVRKPPKESERWDRYRWVGRVATVLAFLLLLWMWDRTTHAVLGVSGLSTQGEGNTRWILLGLQYLLLTPVLFFVTAPLRLALRSAFRLAGHGTFMNLAAPLALVLTIPLAGGLLLDYIAFVAAKVGAA